MIYTSYYGNLEIKNRVNLVSISRSTPGHIKCIHYNQLKPFWALINHYKTHHDIDYYIDQYDRLLAKLDPSEVYARLNNHIILCYEKPSDFCHRHLISEWLRNNGYEADEL
jgi:hypothetical protein